MNANNLKSSESDTKIQGKVMPIENIIGISLRKSLIQAQSLYNKRAFDKAVLVYEKVCLTHPKCLSSKINFAVSLMQLNMSERALEVLFEAEKEFPMDFYVVYNKSVSFCNLKLWEKALQTLDEAIEFTDQAEFLELREQITKKIQNTKQNSKFQFRKQLSNMQTFRKSEKKLTKFTLKSSKTSKFIPNISTESLKVPQKPLTFDELLVKKDIIGKFLFERESQLAQLNKSRFDKADTHLPDGFFQESISEEEFFTGKTKIRVKQEMYETSEIPNISFEEALSGKLTRQEIRFIFQEYNKPVDQRNYSELIRKLSKLPFFHKFPKSIQKMLLKISKLITYGPGETIIEQGDVGECMFIIISGSINIYRQTEEPKGFNIIINSIYDGDAFGELALLSNSKKNNLRRTASCIAGEQTTVISIGKADYRHILLDKMHNDIISRIEFIKSLSFFHGEPWINLIPFASSLEIKSFKVGETVIEQGETPQGMYLVYQGRCKVYWEGYTEVNFVKKRISPRPFITGNHDIFKQFMGKPRFQMSESIDKIFYKKFRIRMKNEENLKAAKYLNSPDLSRKNVKKERFEHQVLKETDFFATRTLFRKHIGPSKFTIVSESKELKIFIISAKNLTHLSEECYVRGYLGIV